MLGAAQCYQKWILGPTLSIQNKKLDTMTKELMDAGKLTKAAHKSTKDRGEEIQAILKNCSVEEQYERDVAMWYGYCQGGGKGAQLALRIFAILKTFGVLYKSQNNDWICTSTEDVPVASLLSHGGRILILLPMSNSLARNVGNKIYTLVKGVTVDPLAALVNRGTYHTMRGKSTVGAVAAHGVLRLTGISSLTALLSTGHKAYDAGDDRFWSWFSGGDVHDRGMATHSTVMQDWSKAPVLPGHRRLWFTEEKAGKSSNARDALMGRHHYKNVALGGVGNINPFSGVTVDKDGAHGHMYINYRPPGYKSFGCILLGVEGSAPGMNNQYGKVHDAMATKGEWSATGGSKWDNIIPLAKSSNKQDVTTWVCDLTDFHTTAAYGEVVGKNFSAANLSDKVGAVREADWTEVIERLRRPMRQ